MEAINEDKQCSDSLEIFYSRYYAMECISKIISLAVKNNYIVINNTHKLEKLIVAIILNIITE